MIEAQQWIIDLMLADIGKVVGSIIIVIATLELLLALKEWLS